MYLSASKSLPKVNSVLRQCRVNRQFYSLSLKNETTPATFISATMVNSNCNTTSKLFNLVSNRYSSFTAAPSTSTTRLLYRSKTIAATPAASKYPSSTISKNEMNISPVPFSYSTTTSSLNLFSSSFTRAFSNTASFSALLSNFNKVGTTTTTNRNIIPSTTIIDKHRCFHTSSSANKTATHQSSSDSDINRKSIKTTKTGSSVNYEKVSIELVGNTSQLLVHCTENGVDSTRVLPFIWLRDHCRCSSCYNHETSQKAFLINPFEQDLGVASAALTEEGSTVVINWRDGHVSKFSMDWLLQNSYHRQARAPLERVLWEADSVRHQLPSVTFSEHMETEEGRLRTIRNIVQYGFAFVHEAPASVDGTQQAVERIVPLQDTFFDQGMWTFTADGAHSDTAWSTDYIGPHTDNTYLEIPAGFQCFHCLSHDGEGGETLLVDGFKVIEELKRTHPDAVRVLSSHLVPHEYKEPPMHGRSGFHLHTLSHIIKLHPATGEPIHFRFNPYDRAPLDTIPPEKVPEFYEAYHQLFTAVTDPRHQLWVKLKPGTVLFIDNWRVMHGRASFNGSRMMCGCYTRRDDWMSTARMLGFVSTTH